jgi:hypothetical protein
MRQSAPTGHGDRGREGARDLPLPTSLIDEVIGLILDVSHEGLVKAHRKKGKGFVRGYQKCVNDVLDEISRWKNGR